MSKKQRKILFRIILSAVLLIIAVAVDKLFIKGQNLWLTLAVYLTPYFIIGYDVLRNAVRNIINGQVFDENFLMSVATIGAVCIGFFPQAEPQYPEAVFVMLFYQTGELFQSIAVGKSRRSISALMDICPDIALIERDGQLIETDPDEISVGDVITVRVGDRIPLDGVVTSGRSSLDTSALTGESQPKTVDIGDAVYSGCINLSGTLTIEVTKPFGESTVSRILELVENSSANKSRSENFITKFARVYTPAVVLAAVVLAFLPPLFSNTGYLAALPDWLIRALTFLVISCPCALVISVPLSFFGAIGGASKKGILIKGSNYLETLAEVDTFVFDKTGTLTKGTFAVTEIKSNTVTENELLQLAAKVEGHSTHPIAVALRNACQNVTLTDVTDVQEIPGHGISANVGGCTVLCGNLKLITSNGITATDPDAVGTVVHVARGGEYLGYIVISDEIKPDAGVTISELKTLGVTDTVMLTGDRKATAESITKAVKLDRCFSDLLPEDKVTALERIMADKEARRKTAYVGDGINDAPVLMRSDVGVAMGVLGSDAAIEAADIVLMDDDIRKLSTAILIARKTVSIVRQNIAFALGVKAAVLILSIFGFTPMWLAVFADVGVAVIAILNAMRTLK